MAPLNQDPQYADARAILDPEGGITPSMLANQSYPSRDNLVIYARYLDAKTRCERIWVEETGAATHGDKAVFYVTRKQYRLLWRNYASLLSGSTSYGEYFSEQTRISEAKEDQVADIERRRTIAAEARKASFDEACAAAGGRWVGHSCHPEPGNPDTKFNCTTDGSTTTCSRQKQPRTD